MDTPIGWVETTPPPASPEEEELLMKPREEPEAIESMEEELEPWLERAMPPPARPLPRGPALGGM